MKLDWLLNAVSLGLKTYDQNLRVGTLKSAPDARDSDDTFQKYEVICVLSPETVHSLSRFTLQIGGGN